MADTNSHPQRSEGDRIGRRRFILRNELRGFDSSEHWLADDTELDELVVLKFFPPSITSDQGRWARVIEGIQNYRRLGHPNIARIYDVFADPDEPAFVSMEYFEGHSLAEWKTAQPARCFAWDYLLPLFSALCSALEHAHAQGIVHGALNPDNLMVNTVGEIKMTELGSRDTAFDSDRKRGQDYLSPQVHAGQAPQPADDIYSLGVILFEMVTSETPRSEQDSPEERLRELGIQNAIPTTVSAVIQSCLAIDPGQRPANAATLGAGIESRDAQDPADPPKTKKRKKKKKRTSRSYEIGITELLIGVTVVGCLLFFAGRAILGFGSQDSFENSLGMKFVPIADAGVLFSVWETRRQDFQVFFESNGKTNGAWKSPGFRQEANHPAVNVSWNDANDFCKWLTAKERREGVIGEEDYYRLPEDLEWSTAVGLPKHATATSGRRKSIDDRLKKSAFGSRALKKKGGVGVESAVWPEDRDPRGFASGNVAFPWGQKWPLPKGAGNYAPYADCDPFAETAPVGSFSANEQGLHDLGGNVGEWCADWYSEKKRNRTIRGASWKDSDREVLISAHRYSARPASRWPQTGFRCVLVKAGEIE